MDFPRLRGQVLISSSPPGQIQRRERLGGLINQIHASSMTDGFTHPTRSFDGEDGQGARLSLAW